MMGEDEYMLFQFYFHSNQQENYKLYFHLKVVI